MLSIVGPAKRVVRLSGAARSALRLTFCLLLGATAALTGASSASANCFMCDPIRDLYDDVGASVLILDSPVLDSFAGKGVDPGPAILVTWTNPASVPAPLGVSLLRAPSGGSFSEIWSCLDSNPGDSTDECAVEAYRDDGGVEPLEYDEVYDYQVQITDGVGVGVSQSQSVTTWFPPPLNLTAHRYPGGEVELNWLGSAVLVGYEVERTNLLTGETTVSFVDPSVSKYVDLNASPDGAYSYDVFSCSRLESPGDCGLFGRAGPSRVGVGGDKLIHGLDERVARHRFRLEEDRHCDQQWDSAFSPSERLIFRDDATGARVERLTNDPQTDVNLYSNRRVWNIDGSRLLFLASDGCHLGWRVMNADGSELRDIEPGDIPSLPASGGGTGFFADWSRSEPDALYYAVREGLMGLLRPPSHLGAQFDEGLVWSLPNAPVDQFWLLLHSDGTEALYVSSNRSSSTPGINQSTAHLIDLLGINATDAEIPMEDEAAAPLFAHQLWFMKQDDGEYAFAFNRHAPSGGQLSEHWMLKPLSDELSVVSTSSLQHSSPSPGGEFLSHITATGTAHTRVATGEMTELDPGVNGHTSWDVDPEWFVASGAHSIWRFWVDGHKTLIATPYTYVMYRGNINLTSFTPQSSPDGTKVAFRSPMFGAPDLFSAVLKLPDPPRNLAIGGAMLEWDSPEHAAEVASYNIWESTQSGAGYTLRGSLSSDSCAYSAPCDCDVCQYAPGGFDPSSHFYRVTAVEPSGLEGAASNEAVGSATAGQARKLWFEPHEGCVARSFGQVYHGDSSALYHLEVTDDYQPQLVDNGSCTPDAVTIDVPDGAYWIWALVRGGGNGSTLEVYNGASKSGLLGEISTDSANWSWVEIDAGALSSIDSGQLTLAPSDASEVGVALDQVLLTTDGAFVPTEIATRLHTSPVALPPVTGLSAQADSFRCTLSWSDPGAENFSHFNVYGSSESGVSSWDQQRLLGSVVKPEFIDWGLRPGISQDLGPGTPELRPGTTYEYRVSVVDRHGSESALAATSCTTTSINRYQLEYFPDPAVGIIEPDDYATGRWSFPYDIPPAASTAGFVGWLRVHLAESGTPSDELRRTVESSTKDLLLAKQMLIVAPNNSNQAPELNTRAWIFVSMSQQSGNLDIYRPGNLSGAGEVTLEPASGTLMSDLRVTGFVLTNDLSYRPEGISDFLLPDTLVALPEFAASAACNDGRDNDGDGQFDFGFDPGCASDADGNEQSALACDDGIDNDLDGETDLDDPGCTGPADAWEGSLEVQCDDGIDNDLDGNWDLDDPDCLHLEVLYEEIPACDDGQDNDGDGDVDFPADQGCNSLADRSEGWDCQDGLDNDGDGAEDYPEDIGCRDSEWPLENPACSDGLDNDGDGFTDWDGGSGGGASDPDCQGRAHRQKEEELPAAPACGLGFELTLALPPLFALRRIRRRLRGDRSSRCSPTS